MGEHTFFARAQNNDGVWSEPASILVTIADSTSCQNPLNRFDGDANGTVAALDVLLVIKLFTVRGTPWRPGKES